MPTKSLFPMNLSSQNFTIRFTKQCTIYESKQNENGTETQMKWWIIANIEASISPFNDSVLNTIHGDSITEQKPGLKKPDIW